MRESEPPILDDFVIPFIGITKLAKEHMNRTMSYELKLSVPL